MAEDILGKKLVIGDVVVFGVARKRAAKLRFGVLKNITERRLVLDETTGPNSNSTGTTVTIECGRSNIVKW